MTQTILRSTNVYILIIYINKYVIILYKHNYVYFSCITRRLSSLDLLILHYHNSYHNKIFFLTMCTVYM